jgi:hypothetical protein
MIKTQIQTFDLAKVSVAQSTLIHPEWDLGTHLDFLTSEGIDVNAHYGFHHIGGRKDGLYAEYPLKTFVANWLKDTDRLQYQAGCIKRNSL